MKKLVMVIGILAIISCSKKDPSDPRNSKIISSKLKDTYWELPYYTYANIAISEATATLALSEGSVLSNGDMKVLFENTKENIVVFNTDNRSQNYVVGIQYIDPETIKLGLVSPSNDVEGYKKELGILGVEMKKRTSPTTPEEEQVQTPA